MLDSANTQKLHRDQNIYMFTTTPISRTWTDSEKIINTSTYSKYMNEKKNNIMTDEAISHPLIIWKPKKQMRREKAKKMRICVDKYYQNA